MLPAVHIVILNWNNASDTIECLASVQKLKYGNYVPVLIDNGSQDDSIEKIIGWFEKNTLGTTNILNFSAEIADWGSDLISDEFKSKSPYQKLILIKSTENLGFAKGCNLGIEFALSSGADFVFLLNNDTVVTADSLGHLVSFMEKEKNFAGASAQVRYYDRQDTVNQCGGKLLWYGARKYYYNDVLANEVPLEGFKKITFVNGCAVLFRASLFQQAGMLTERFFFGEEDFEFSWRLKKMKILLACCYEAIVYHKVSSSINQASKDECGKIYIHYLNRFINVRQNTSAAFWFLWKYAYLLYIYFLLRKRVELKRIFPMFKMLLNQSAHLDKVDRDYFFKALKGELIK